MGIQSTRYISREQCIERIKSIVELIEDADWVTLYDKLDDEDYVKDDYVNIYNDLHKDYINNNNLFKEVSKWPNDYLEKFMDEPGIRYSLFENYFIK